MGHSKFKQSHGSECHHSHHCVSALQIISHFRFNVNVTFLSQHHAWKHITWVKIQEEAFIPCSPHVSSDSQNNTFKMNEVCVDIFRSMLYLCRSLLIISNKMQSHQVFSQITFGFSFHILIHSFLLLVWKEGNLCRRLWMPDMAAVWCPLVHWGGRCLYLSRSINECRGKAGRIPKSPLGLINYPENTSKDRIWVPPIKII